MGSEQHPTSGYHRADYSEFGARLRQLIADGKLATNNAGRPALVIEVTRQLVETWHGPNFAHLARWMGAKTVGRSRLEHATVLAAAAITYFEIQRAQLGAGEVVKARWRRLDVARRAFERGMSSRAYLRESNRMAELGLAICRAKTDRAYTDRVITAAAARRAATYVRIA